MNRSRTRDEHEDEDDCEGRFMGSHQFLFELLSRHDPLSVGRVRPGPPDESGWLCQFGATGTSRPTDGAVDRAGAARQDAEPYRIGPVHRKIARLHGRMLSKDENCGYCPLGKVSTILNTVKSLLSNWKDVA